MILSALLLAVILHFLARHEAEYSLPHMLLVSAGLWVANLVLGLALGPLGLVLSIPLMIWALHQFCYLQWGKATLATVIFYVIQIGISLVLSPPVKTTG